ncbi:tyrosine-type recombinase/integrase [Flavobacterium algicola]|uniref:tyrosine-type recombinase/integrase n=1 Tax=Flavobacterium algicola TaxID=556529 RepID=UPI001EFEBC62|nr:phage integrase SAM-like domain-containing protein [Flavobacterium algicola]MCG9792516.1 site-specific integrase [Flavobacterium algicola]
MKIEIKLFDNEKETGQGFPLAVSISHQGKRKRKNIAFCQSKHFLVDGKTISEKHPDYDTLAPILMNLKIKARKLILKSMTDIDKVYQELFAVDFSQIGFIEYADGLIAEMEKMAAEMAKYDLKGSNKIIGNIKCYKNVIAQFGNFAQNTSLQNLDFETLQRFKNYNLSVGNSKSTIHLYLRTLRTIYNKGIMIHRLVDEKPFATVFSGLKVRAYDSRKKYLEREAITELETTTLFKATAKQKYLDLFLLQFYFGGCDLIDIYYLKERQLRKGRVIFERTKTNTGTRIDLKLHPKAAEIINKYKTSSEWLFPWGKEKNEYEIFRRTYQRALIYIQEKLNLEVQPDGGHIAVKVARHSFANRAKVLMIESDITRELMGHERDDVDNYYKDKYPEKVRDMALFEIISPFECLK